jgi:hypothetical protein
VLGSTSPQSGAKQYHAAVYRSTPPIAVPQSSIEPSRTPAVASWDGNAVDIVQYHSTDAM